MRKKQSPEGYFRIVHCFLFFVLLLLLPGCSGRENTPAMYTEPESAPAVQEQTADDTAAEYDALRQEAARIAAALDDRQLAAQVILSGIDGKERLGGDMKIILTECPSGGIMLFRYNLDADNDTIQNFLAESSAVVTSGASVPPFIAVDHEGGAVNRFRADVADLPPAASYFEMARDDNDDTVITQIYTDSFSAGTAIKRLGINLNFAPVAEYINGDNHDFLANRSYGPDPDFTAKAAGAFIAGMESAGILCVVKHFPGSAGADPHLYPSVLPGDKAALAELTSPFAALIRNNHARAIMVSHSGVPAWDSTLIASLSPVIMGEWLRQELGFEGIIICDDFSMAAASSQRPEIAAVLSLAAGADMVLVWPPDIRRTHRAIMAALSDESANDDRRLSRERLREAAERIIFEKLRIGLIAGSENGQ